MSVHAVLLLCIVAFCAAYMVRMNNRLYEGSCPICGSKDKAEHHSSCPWKG